MSALGFSLFEELADYQERELAKVASAGTRAARERFRILGRTYFEWAIREPHFFNLMFSDFCLIESSVDQGREENRAYKTLIHCLDDLVETGSMDKKLRSSAELLSWSVVHGTTSLIVSGHLDTKDFELALDSLEIALGIRR